MLHYSQLKGLQLKLGNFDLTSETTVYVYYRLTILTQEHMMTSLCVIMCSWYCKSTSIHLPATLEIQLANVVLSLVLKWKFLTSICCRQISASQMHVLIRTGT